MESYFSTLNKKNNFMAHFNEWGSTASRLGPLQGGSLLYLLILSNSEGRNAELTLEPPNGF